MIQGCFKIIGKRHMDKKLNIEENEDMFLYTDTWIPKKDIKLVRKINNFSQYFGSKSHLLLQQKKFIKCSCEDPTDKTTTKMCKMLSHIHLYEILVDNIFYLLDLSETEDIECYIDGLTAASVTRAEESEAEHKKFKAFLKGPDDLF